VKTPNNSFRSRSLSGTFLPRWLLIVLLAVTGCSKPESRMTRLQKYAEEHHITYIEEFPIYFNVEIAGAPDLRADMETWLLTHGFQKGLGAAYARDGTLVSQQYLFGEIFSIDISSSVGNVSLCGYGIRATEQDVEPTLKTLLGFLETKHKVVRKELKYL
jgi:hypothetical protein